MFLSNQQAVIAIFLISLSAIGCSYFQSNGSSAGPSSIAPPTSSIPFETAEPEIYQADFVTIAGGSEARSHLARKSGQWRFDSFNGSTPTRSIIQTEKQTYLDHPSRTYSEPPTGNGQERPQFMSDITASLLTQGPPSRFEKIGSEGKMDKYRVTPDGSETAAVITYDTEIMIITRHEMGDGFAFEMRNFTLEVDDAIFQVPPGYRKIAWAEFIKK